MKRTHTLTLIVLSCVFLLAVGCALLPDDWSKDGGLPDIPDAVTNVVDAVEDDPAPVPDPDPTPLPPARPPVSTDTIPVSGEYRPDPVIVKYVAGFADGTVLTFKENHGGDYWGDYPAAGWGQIRWPDGREQGIDVNTLIRKRYNGKEKTPVTTPDHGRRMFWMADSEGNRDVKRVEIFEDGWNPLVEGRILAAQNLLGIKSHLITCTVTVERRK